MIYWRKASKWQTTTKGLIHNAPQITADPMIKIVDRPFSLLLMLGAVGHLFGSIATYEDSPETLLWAVSASVLMVLLGALNLLRTNRPDDRALAWITGAGSLCWAGVAVAFGVVIENVLDPRAVLNVVFALGLACFSIKAAISARWVSRTWQNWRRPRV